MITIHHLEQSRSMRILWLLEELGAPYQIKHYQRDPVTSLAPPELLQVHPLGKSPIIEDGDITLPETGAIVEYLIGKYDQGQIGAPMRPERGSREEVDYLHWIHFAEGTAMPPLVMSLVMSKVSEAKMPFFAKPIANGIVQRVRGAVIDRNIQTQLDFVEKSLEGHDYMVGNHLTGADILMGFPLEAAAARAGAAQGRPNLKRFLATIHARPAYLRALKKAGPYDFGPQD